MNREKRSVTLAILTLVVYASFLFYDTGAILFPFPLNELIVLIVSIQFLIWNWHAKKSLLVILTAANIFNLISTQFFWSFFMTNEQMEVFVSGISLDLLKIAYYLFLLIGLGIYFLTSTSRLKYLFFGITLLPILFTMFTSIGIFETISFILIALLGYKYKINYPIHLLWFLIGILQLMKVSTLYF